jgi:hypothetical protein
MPRHMPETISKMRWSPPVTERALRSPEGGRHPLRLASSVLRLRPVGGCPPRSRRRVGALVREVASSVTLRERAERMAASMVHEDGAGLAVRRLEMLAAASMASPDSKPRATTSITQPRKRS